MGTTTTMFVFVWILNILIFLAQLSMIQIGGVDAVLFYNKTGTVFEGYTTTDGSPAPDASKIGTELNPSESSGLEETTGVFFIDAILSVKKWITDKVDYFTAIIMGPYNILLATGLPRQAVGPIALLWYAISIFLLIAFIFGRDK